MSSGDPAILESGHSSLAGADRIEKSLRILEGLPLWAIGRVPGLAWFRFGGQRVIQTRRGTNTVGDYALHVQCTWRLSGPSSIVVGWNDLFYRAGANPYADLDNFDWEVQGANRFDERISAFLAQHASAPLKVVWVRLEKFGGIAIGLGRNYAIEIFPNTSLSGEIWRLFRPGSEERHLVVTTTGVEA
jgi:hypothetical protein